MHSCSTIFFGAVIIRIVAASKWVDCAAGTNYYVCAANGFRGCCSVDACNTAWCPDAGLPPPPPGTGNPGGFPYPGQCAAGKQYYVCASNGFAGCCSIDACNADWCPDAGSPPPPPGTGKPSTRLPPAGPGYSTLSTVVGGAPPPTSTPPPGPPVPSAQCTAALPSSISHAPVGPRPTDCPAGSTGKEVWGPTVYSVWHDQPQREGNASSVIIISQDYDNNKITNKRDAVLVFPVPKGAKNCAVRARTLGQGQNFGYYNHAAFVYKHMHLNGRSFKDAVGAAATWEKVKAVVGKEAGQSDMTAWAERTIPQEYSNSKVECAEDTAVLVSLMEFSYEGTLVLGNGNGTLPGSPGAYKPEHGFYLTYDC
ncbi:hypothetical protein P154DRAFT_38530 [Amniculicola lignicola CBS 123094]|uniref:Carbohydrate-binding module family 18 protein n=1 Tax=Amniculicola lignicola CBS 123094 TaxID=1392246 RepID=A0A6A5VYV9_9PLEO|nr:hypothetical protein P154DRAFT_38530 [Amniculicola lignicola CBS 123094]